MESKSKRKILIRIIYIILITTIILSSTCIAKVFLLRQEAIAESELLNEIDVGNELQKELEKEAEEQKKKEEAENKKKQEETEKAEKEKEKKERMLKVKKLQETNSDIVGWLEIVGTNINYPVLQGEDNEYYLTHNYKKQKTEKGSIFLDAKYNWKISSNNLLIYGHNLVNGQMFKDLIRYREEDFYKKHSTIRFTTEKEDIEFEIMSAFYSNVFYENDTGVFRYYDFINAKKKAEYNEFVKNAKRASLYDTGVEAEYGERLITLITCSYHEDDGRFVVIGRENE